MSMLRLTTVRRIPGAPEWDGRYVEDAWNGVKGTMPALAARPPLPPPGHPLREYIANSIDRLAPGGVSGPVVTMVHGFDFDPRKAYGDPTAAKENPHYSLFHFGQEREAPGGRRRAGWPRGLGFTDPDGDGTEGLCVAFGWMSASTGRIVGAVPTPMQYRRAFGHGSEASWTLLATLEVLRERLPEARLNLLAHSLGTHVVLNAIRCAAREGMRDLLRSLGRIVLLAGAEYRSDAEFALAEFDRVAGRDARLEIYNVSCVFDKVVSLLGSKVGPRGVAPLIGGYGLSVRARGEFQHRWLDVPIDHQIVQGWFRSRLGFNLVGDGEGWGDHWHHFTVPDHMRLYNRLFRDTGFMRLATLYDGHDGYPLIALE